MEKDRFIERVRKEAGLPPASFVDSGLAADQSHRVDDHILELGERYACELLLDEPLYPDQPMKEFSPFFLWETNEEGEYIGKAPLPQDFLRLGSLRMDSWEEVLTELVEPSQSEWRLRHVGFAPLAGSSRRPRGYLVPASGGLRLEIHACRLAGEKVAEGCYVPRPDFSGEEIEGLGATAMEKIIERVSDRLRSSS